MNYKITLSAAQLEIVSAALGELKARREVVETVNAISAQIQKQNDESYAQGVAALMEAHKAQVRPARKGKAGKLTAVA